jgi:hypothetical protein
MNQDTFYSAGERERHLLQHLAYTTGIDFIIMTMERCQYDALAVTPKGKIVMFEAKVRQCEHDRYDSTLIEYPKYADLLMRWTKDECALPVYVEFYSDGFARMYNLAKIVDLEWRDKRLNRTTYGDNGDVSKRVAYIDYSNGTLVKLRTTPIDEI